MTIDEELYDWALAEGEAATVQSATEHFGTDWPQIVERAAANFLTYLEAPFDALEDGPEGILAYIIRTDGE